MRLLLAVLMILPALALADDLEYKMTIRDHRFEPSELRVPVGKKVKLIIENLDATAEEFDSHALNREKVIPPKSTGFVFVGPLSPGRYPFMGEFHSDTAQGILIAE